MTGVRQSLPIGASFRRLSASASLCALAVLAVPCAVQAQSIGYDSAGSSMGGSAGSGMGGSDQDEAPVYRPGKSGKKSGKGSKRLEVKPYIEVDQIVNAELSPGNDVLTYTQVAAGLDAGIAGRNNAASMSVRYERQFGWGKKARDGDAISGIVRGYTTVVPGVTLEAGGLATRASVGGTGSSVVSDKTRTNIYSVYGGPSVATRAGAVNVTANYRAGFTKVDGSSNYVTSAGTAAADTFDKSVTQVADVEAGVAPGDVLPVGLAVGGTFYQEDISNLDQRVRDMQARAMVTVPLSRTVQAVGSIGYEDVEISSRDAGGNPVIGSDGRYVTNKSAPRVLAYDVSGLTWDVAVMWRPSRRTSLSAHVGRRYGSTSFGGTLSYAPDDRSQLSVAVYDNIAGFGGQLNRLIDKLPDDFEAVRDPVTGELTGCVSSLDGSNCLSGALASLRSSTFRARGVAASYSVKLGGLNAGLGLGYDRRKFIAAQGTVLASANGLVDETYWLAAYLSGRLGRDAGWSANAYANWLSSTDPQFADANTYGASASYFRLLTRRLRASLAVGIDGTTRKDPAIDDIWTASALAGLRYNF